MRPGPSLAGVRLVIPDRAMGLPVLRALSLCTCCRHYPGAATGRRLRSSRPAVSAFPENVVGLACTSSFSRLARRLLALRPAHSRSHLYVTRYTEGFSHFVTSMTTPVASGWSVRRVGLAPTGKRRLLTAHANSRHSPAAQSLLKQSAGLLPQGRNSRNFRKFRDIGRIHPEHLRVLVRICVYVGFSRTPRIKARVAAEDGPNAGDGRLASGACRGGPASRAYKSWRR